MSDVVWVVAGLAGLVTGGDLLVRGAVALAQRLGVSPLIIGLTLVGFGTSTPELVASLQAALAGSPGLAIGNVVGSNIGNILLILGLAALLSPIRVDPAALRRDGAVMALAALICTWAILEGTLGRATGAGFLGLLALYLVLTVMIERRSMSAAAALYRAEADLVTPAEPSASSVLKTGPKSGPNTGLLRPVLTVLAGLVLTILAARALVTGAIGLAATAGVSETAIGLTVVALGTSLPELVTSLVAVRRGQGDVAFGNIVGSNIFNVLGILGTTAMVLPLEVPAQVASFDIWVMLAATLALAVFAATGQRIDRREGAVLVTAYGGYLATLALTA
ncbi:calcium/sodium antiporter [Rhodalgimonas zhirmunskyi]|uniref:Calcium/sodium antiporter n=1 Tax=Rhodalgimonas zhirmunskyi TaxID=2964767 RepID=A0AAJ1X537_9RHOB|nr:calcium/sodium antiporter [Rhodoalgimonas zhirmunskyi]MDQ2094868.1 calcium/sodium antiporter [Rhodoalgimonas zhirmunskyi]